MDSKPLLFGLIGFFLGGLIVSTAAVTFEKPAVSNSNSHSSDSSMTTHGSLEGKSGDEFDQAFLDEMIKHHQGAIEMALLAEENAKHQEIKDLSEDIIATQAQEIEQMNQWQKDWGYIKNQSHDDGQSH